MPDTSTETLSGGDGINVTRRCGKVVVNRIPCEGEMRYPKTQDFNRKYGIQYIMCYPKLQKILNDYRVTFASAPALYMINDREGLNFPFDKSYFKTVEMYQNMNKVCSARMCDHLLSCSVLTALSQERRSFSFCSRWYDVDGVCLSWF